MFTIGTAVVDECHQREKRARFSELCNRGTSLIKGAKKSRGISAVSSILL